MLTKFNASCSHPMGGRSLQEVPTENFVCGVSCHLKAHGRGHPWIDLTCLHIALAADSSSLTLQVEATGPDSFPINSVTFSPEGSRIVSASDGFLSVQGETVSSSIYIWSAFAP